MFKIQEFVRFKNLFVLCQKLMSFQCCVRFRKYVVDFFIENFPCQILLIFIFSLRFQQTTNLTHPRFNAKLCKLFNKNVKSFAAYLKLQTHSFALAMQGGKEGFVWVLTSNIKNLKCCCCLSLLLRPYMLSLITVISLLFVCTCMAFITLMLILLNRKLYLSALKVCFRFLSSKFELVCVFCFGNCFSKKV